MKLFITFAAAMALGLGGYAMACWLTRPSPGLMQADPVQAEADRGILAIEHYLRAQEPMRP